ncbi:MAG: 16S rRNA (guanine(527)-N(7))-methyltransferase RsmG [Bacteroidales bacterium]|nr:16S rRNA (guanine(527)-N(7))-methyltransferase RsmG [Bacteroidales bacterium]MBO5848787.1 16S rRNA (guanine(527)-N(7))-methyltransferase RsmG [Bacteroidales bacterium]
MDHTIIKKYFPELTEIQMNQYQSLLPLYEDWNSKINVISRKDMDCFYEHHVLHSLAIAKYFTILPGMKVMDVGTGGGFPGIPLAIMFPQTDFMLVDSIGKKIKVVQAVAESLGLTNVVAVQERVEKIKDKFDIITSRAVTRLPEIAGWVGNKLRIHNDIEAGGILYLKGGDIEDELREVPKNWKRKTTSITKWYAEPYFVEKYVVHLY